MLAAPRLLSALVLLASLAAPVAWANPVKNLYDNLARLGKRLPVPQQQVRAEATLIKGLYTLNTTQGEFVGMTNDAGTLFGSSSGFEYVPATAGETVRPLTAEESAALRTQALAALDTSQLPRVQYGDGGGRSLLLFSAVDCPYCQRMEDNLRRLSGQINTTIYVVPSSLRPYNQTQGAQAWAAVGRIWCARDPGAAWLQFWKDRVTPADSRACAYAQPEKAHHAASTLRNVLRGTGVSPQALRGVPALLDENGQKLSVPTDMSASFAAQAYGAAGKPAAPAPSRQWLTP